MKKLIAGLAVAVFTLGMAQEAPKKECSSKEKKECSTKAKKECKKACDSKKKEAMKKAA